MTELSKLIFEQEKYKLYYSFKYLKSNTTCKYVRDCSAHCVVPTKVGHSTYYNHAPFQNQLDVSFGNFAALSGQSNALGGTI